MKKHVCQKQRDRERYRNTIKRKVEYQKNQTSEEGKLSEIKKEAAYL